MNESWRTWIQKQLDQGKSKILLEEVLKKENYSDVIIKEVVYSDTTKTNDAISKQESTLTSTISNQQYTIKPTEYTISNLKLSDTEYKITYIYDSPKIFSITNFLTEEECDHMIAIGKPNLKRALVSDKREGVVSAGRTGKNCWIRHRTDEITYTIAKRIAGLINIPLTKTENFQLIYYDKTQEYRNHYDGWLHDNSEKSNRNFKKGGQRLWTALCYLNKVTEGGGTHFPRLQKTVTAEKGKLVVFQDVYDGTTELHKLSEHAGMPVIEGEKYAFNLWFKDSRFG
jgi:prolyl 4-hydroxylase